MSQALQSADPPFMLLTNKIGGDICLVIFLPFCTRNVTHKIVGWASVTMTRLVDTTTTKQIALDGLQRKGKFVSLDEQAQHQPMLESLGLGKSL